MDKQNIDYYYAEWDKALAHGDVEKALTVAFVGYELSRSGASELHERYFFNCLIIAASQLHERLIPQYSRRDHFKDRCSFCGALIEGRPHVLGADVSICSDCITLASNVIKPA